MGLNRNERASDLVEEVTKVSVLVTGVVADVDPVEFTTEGLSGPTGFAFTGVLGRDDALEGVLVDQESNFIRCGQVGWVVGVEEAFVGDRLSVGLDEVRESVYAYRVEAEWLWVDGEFDAAEVNVDPGVVPEGLFTILKTTGRGYGEDVVYAGLVAHDIGDLWGSDEERVFVGA